MKSLGWAVVGALLAGAGACGQDAAAVPDGLLLHYSFDVDGGDVVADASGHGRSAEVHGAQWVADGARGGAYRFDSNDECIWADDAGLPQGDEPRTMAVWIKLNVLYPEMTTGLLTYGRLQWNQASGVGMDWRNGRDQYYFSQNGGVALSRQKMASPGEWHHLAYVYEGNGRHHLYVDGVPTDGMSELRGALNTVPSGRLIIGGHPGSAGPNGGFLDDVRIYGRALAAEEIAELAARPETAAPSATEETRAKTPMAAEPKAPVPESEESRLSGEMASSPALEMRQVKRGPEETDSMELQWVSIPGQAYEVEWTDDLSKEFTVIASNLIAAGEETSFTNRMSGARMGFYRVKRQE